MENLDSCPFCGGDAILVPYSTCSGSIACIGECGFESRKYWDDPMTGLPHERKKWHEIAAEAWNRRANDEQCLISIPKVPICHGDCGATTANAARANLGIMPMKCDDLILKSALLADLQEYLNQEVTNDMRFTDMGEGIDLAMERVKEAPAVDAEPVRNGEWAHLGGDEWCCTVCGDVIHTEGSWEKPTRKYCSECGAKMHVEVENAAD